MSSKLIIFSAPSGSGKTTIVKYLLTRQLNLEFSISVCSRIPRKGEINGKDYYFITTEEFKQKIATNQFIEWEEVYDGNYYGTLKTELERIWSNGNHVLFDIDVKGGINLKKIFKDQSLSVFVMPPSIEELKKRLLLRSSDDHSTIQKRIEKSVYEMTFADKFDIVLLNDNLLEAEEKAYNLVHDFILEIKKDVEGDEGT